MAIDRSRDLLIEGARIAFRNFRGEKDQFNAAGNRQFAIFLNEEDVVGVEAKGYNVKRLKPREEDDVPQAYLQVKVKYDNFPPKIYTVTSRGRTLLSVDLIELLDTATITNADVIIRPYDWTVNGKSGTTAYLGELFVTLEESPLDQKYADIGFTQH